MSDNPFVFEVKSSSFEKELFPAGTYEARILRVVDVGIQKPLPKYEFDDKGRQKSPTHQIFLSFEASDLTITINKDGEDKVLPALFFKSGTISFGDRATFGSILKAASKDSKLDISKLVGMAVSLELTEETGKDGVVRNKLVSVKPVSKKVESIMEPLKGKAEIFSMNGDDVALFETLPDFMKEKIRGALNFPNSNIAKALGSSGSPSNEGGKDSNVKVDF